MHEVGKKKPISSAGRHFQNDTRNGPNDSPQRLSHRTEILYSSLLYNSDDFRSSFSLATYLSIYLNIYPSIKTQKQKQNQLLNGFYIPFSDLW